MSPSVLLLKPFTGEGSTYCCTQMLFTVSVAEHTKKMKITGGLPKQQVSNLGLKHLAWGDLPPPMHMFSYTEDQTQQLYLRRLEPGSLKPEL